MKRICLLLFVLFSLTAHAQDTFVQKTTAGQDSVSNSLTAEYNKKLALTGKQELLFKKKLTEFLIEKDKVENSLNGKKKLDVLYKIGQQENGEMRDILTREQYDLYLRIKPSLQPLEKVKMEK